MAGVITMRTLLTSIMLASLALPLTVTAQEYINLDGEVYRVGNKSINIGDMEVPLLATTKIILSGDKKGRLDDVKKGQYVEASLLILDNKTYVDTLRITKGPKPDEE
jgi:hypothetical protein